MLSGRVSGPAVLPPWQGDGQRLQVLAVGQKAGPQQASAVHRAVVAVVVCSAFSLMWVVACVLCRLGYRG